MAAHTHFRMSALTAMIAIRRYIANYPEASAESAAVSVRRIDADSAASDFELGLEIHGLLPAELTFSDPAGHLRLTLARLITLHRPWWIKGMPYGRERLTALLERDEAQCFRASGLFEEPASEPVVRWWDELAQAVRAGVNDRLLLQGREAERLSLAHEEKRLADFGITRAPRWVAIEDNGAGYDILSYDVGTVEPTSRLIEVKSSTQNPPRLILTRGEWEAALHYGEVYRFHLWVLPSRTLIERTVVEIAPHIPTDQGQGVWALVEIDVTARTRFSG
jgi:hypothetical protein